MVHVVKVSVDKNSSSEKQIRRVAVSSDIIECFKLLEKKIVDLFSFYNDQVIEIKWKDSDNDYICISSDEELAQAVANMEDGILRLFVNVQGDNELNNAKNPKKQKQSKVGKEHPGIVCDGCNKIINGNRYKCLQCKDFDLCSSCNENDEHPDHDFLKLIKPVQIPREWAFLGSRKLWKSMFHTFHKYNADKKNKFADSGVSSGKCEPVPDIFSKILTGHCFDEAQNFFYKVLEDINAFNNGTSATPNSQRNFDCGEKKETEEKKADYSSTSNDKTCIKLPETDNSNEIAETKEGHTEPKICTPVAGECSYNNDKPDGPILKNEKISSAEDTIVSEGWTILHNDENKDISTSAQLCETEKTSVYPSLEHQVNVLNENEVHPSLDAKIASAVETMKSMGFTNENRWLEHLLLTKNGNIIEALEALYPSMN